MLWEGPRCHVNDSFIFWAATGSPERSDEAKKWPTDPVGQPHSPLMSHPWPQPQAGPSSLRKGSLNPGLLDGLPGTSTGDPLSQQVMRGVIPG